MTPTLQRCTFNLPHPPYAEHDANANLNHHIATVRHNARICNMSLQVSLPVISPCGRRQDSPEVNITNTPDRGSATEFHIYPLRQVHKRANVDT